MSTKNHTDIALGASGNAATINAPLGQLDQALADVESLFGDYVITGGLPPTSASLNITVPATRAFVLNTFVSIGANVILLPATKDNYIDLDSGGILHVTSVANGAAAPAIFASSIRLCMAVTSGAAVTSVTDYRIPPPTWVGIYGLSVKSFGAVMDGVTDDTVAVNNAVAAVNALWRKVNVGLLPQHYGPSFDLHFPGPARMRLTRRVGGNQFEGGLKFLPGVNLIGHGVTVIMDDTAFPFLNAADAPLLYTGATQATITADVAAGDQTFTVGSSAGFSVGDGVFCRMGEDPIDTPECPNWLHAYVSAVPDGTHITLDRPIRDAMTVAGITNALNKTITRKTVDTTFENFLIKGFHFEVGPTGGIVVDKMIRLVCALNWSIEDCTGYDVGAGLTSLQYCEHGRIVKPKILHSKTYSPGDAHGRCFTFSECRDITVYDAHGEGFESAFAFLEVSSRIIFAGQTRMILNNANRASGQLVHVSEVNGGIGTSCWFENLEISGVGTNAQLSENDSSSRIYYGEVTDNCVPMLQIGPVFKRVARRLRVVNQPAALVGDWGDIRRASFTAMPKVNTASQDILTLPDGIIRRCWVYASSVTGLTSVSLRHAATNSNDFHANLVAGSSIDVFTAFGGLAAYGTTRTWVNAGYTPGSLRVSTDGTLVPGTYLTVQVEYWAPSDFDTALADSSKQVIQQPAPPILVPLTDAATIATDASLGDVFTVTIAGNRTMGAPTNPFPGKRIAYQITQDGTGGRTLAWNAAFVLSSFILNGTIGAVSSVRFCYNGTSWIQEDDATGANKLRRVFALTDAATVVSNANLAEKFTAALTANRTIGLPSNPVTGMIRTYQIQNSKGSAMTTAWNAVFVFTNGAWVDPANTLRRSITFEYDGTNWIELYRATADF